MGPLTETRINALKSTLKEAAGQPILTEDLMKKMGLTNKNVFYAAVYEARKLYPDRICVKYRPNAKLHENDGYFWKFDPKADTNMDPNKLVEAKKSEDARPALEVLKEIKSKYDDKRTEEGYSDPTASAAMDNVEKELKVVSNTLERDSSFDNSNVAPGDIWEYSGNTGNITVVVIASRKNMVSVIQIFYDLNDVFPAEQEEMKRVCVAGRYVYFNPGKLTAKPYKYFVTKTGEFSEKAFNELKCYLGLYLNISTEAQVITREVVRQELVNVGPTEEEIQKRIDEAVKEALDKVEPVVKEVVKEVEVPVNVGGITEEEVRERIKTAVDEAILKRERDIYHDIIFKGLLK